MLKRLFALFLAVSLIFVFTATLSASPQDPTSDTHLAPSDLSAESAILAAVDQDGDLIEIFGKSERKKMGMASTTKIMTALTALSLADQNTKIAVSPLAVGIEGSSVYLVAGETLSLRELIYALLLSSANDAAVAIAIGICGSVEEFVREMNELALRIGAKDTNFKNPHGLYDEAHYTTAYDLALITSHALENELILEAVSTQKTTIPHPELEYGRLLVNHNKMLKLYESAIGVKTGFTKKTGRCLVSAAERDGLRLIAVTLNASDDWNDHTKLLDHGFNSYEMTTLYGAGELSLPFSVVGGTSDEVILTNSSAIRLVLPKDTDKKNIKMTVLSTQRFLFAPVESSESVAEVTFEYEGRRVSSELVTTLSVSRKQTKRKGFFDLFFKD